MALTKRGKRGIWHFDFIYRGRRFQGSTRQTNINKAVLVESKIRSDVALEDFGIGPPKTAPTLTDFLEGAFQQDVDRHAKAKRTARFYRDKVKRLLAFTAWAGCRLSEIDGEWISKYTEYRSKTIGHNALNGELATLRKALRLAEEFKLIKKAPKVRLLPPPKGRDFIVSMELEAEYIAAASYPLKQAAILILDLGFRPEELVSLKRGDVMSASITVRDGKSKNAARQLPLTERASCQIEELSAFGSDSEFLFPGRKGKHFTRGALDNLHAKLRAEKGWPEEFVLYSFRHTFGTRLAESGASPFHITALMGHYDVRMSQRYVHSQPEGLSLTMKRKEAMDKLLRGEATAAEVTAVERGTEV